MFIDYMFCLYRLNEAIYRKYMYVFGRHPGGPPGPGGPEDPEPGPVGVGRGRSELVGAGRVRNSEPAGQLDISERAGI